MTELNKGLIFTNDNCIGCNRCIYSCPVLGANISKINNGKNRIYVDPDKCIHCGKCIETCRHGARAAICLNMDMLSLLHDAQRQMMAEPFWYFPFRTGLPLMSFALNLGSLLPTIRSPTLSSP